MAASSNSSLSGSSVSSGEFQPTGAAAPRGLSPPARAPHSDGESLPVAVLPALPEGGQAAALTLVWLAGTLGRPQHLRAWSPTAQRWESGGALGVQKWGFGGFVEQQAGSEASRAGSHFLAPLNRGWRGGEGKGAAGRPDPLAVRCPLHWMPRFKARGSKASLFAYFVFFVCFRN